MKQVMNCVVRPFVLVSWLFGLNQQRWLRSGCRVPRFRASDHRTSQSSGAGGMTVVQGLLGAFDERATTRACCAVLDLCDSKIRVRKSGPGNESDFAQESGRRRLGFLKSDFFVPKNSKIRLYKRRPILAIPGF